MATTMERSELRLPCRRGERFGDAGSYILLLTDVADLRFCRFPYTGVALRPGFVYGWRRTKKGQGIPLQLVGAPVSMLARDLGAFSTALSYMPFFGEEMRAAIPVGAVAKAAVLSAIGPVHGQTLDTSNMLEIAASFHIHE